MAYLHSFKQPLLAVTAVLVGACTTPLATNEGEESTSGVTSPERATDRGILDAGAPSQQTPTADAGSGVPAESKAWTCADANIVVYRGENATGQQALAMTPEFPEGFTSRGPAFRLFPGAGDENPIYLLMYNGDPLLSQSPTEGTPAYSLMRTLGYARKMPFPGGAKLERWIRTVLPFDHGGSLEATALPASFRVEGVMGYVCPP